MAVYYFDASAVVKYFHSEPGTAWVRQVVDRLTKESRQANLIYLAEISRVETPAAFAILARTQRISVRARDALYDSFLQKVGRDFQSLPLTPAIIRRAGELTQEHPLKAYDAVQLAVALDLDATLGEENIILTFVSGDDNLLQAAQAEKLATENPFAHRDLDLPQ